MKRLSGLMLAVAIVLGATPGYAQVSGCVLGGVNFTKASISGEDATCVDTQFQTGLIVGGFVELPVSSTVPRRRNRSTSAYLAVWDGPGVISASRAGTTTA